MVRRSVSGHRGGVATRELVAMAAIWLGAIASDMGHPELAAIAAGHLGMLEAHVDELAERLVQVSTVYDLGD